MNISSGANIINAIQNLKMAQEQFEDFERQFPNSQGSRLFKKYNDKINWIFSDIITHPFLPNIIRDGIREEIKSDVFAVPAILEKIALLTPEQREIIEDVLDAYIYGETVKIVDINEINEK